MIKHDMDDPESMAHSSYTDQIMNMLTYRVNFLMTFWGIVYLRVTSLMI